MKVNIEEQLEDNVECVCVCVCVRGAVGGLFSLSECLEERGRQMEPSKKESEVCKHLEFTQINAKWCTTMLKKTSLFSFPAWLAGSLINWRRLKITARAQNAAQETKTDKHASKKGPRKERKIHTHTHTQRSHLLTCLCLCVCMVCPLHDQFSDTCL